MFDVADVAQVDEGVSKAATRAACAAIRFAGRTVSPQCQVILEALVWAGKTIPCVEQSINYVSEVLSEQVCAGVNYASNVLSEPVHACGCLGYP